MTPTHKNPSHVEDQGYSNVFHREHPGKVVAKFFGENHVADAIEHAQSNHMKQPTPAVNADQVKLFIATASPEDIEAMIEAVDTRSSELEKPVYQVETDIPVSDEVPEKWQDG